MRTLQRLGTGLGLLGALLIAAGCQQGAPPQQDDHAAMDHSAHHKATVEAFVEMWNTGTTDGIEAVVGEGFVRNAPAGGSTTGIDGLKSIVDKFHTAFPDMGIVADKIVYLEDSAYVHWTVTGTNTGPGDWEPTGKAIRISGLTEARLQDGKIVGENVFFDTLDWMQQLGFTLQPPAKKKS